MSQTNINLAQIAAILQGTPQALRILLNPLDPAILRWHPTDREWCINQIIGHLIEADNCAFAGRINLILNEQQPEIPRWRAAAAVAARNDCERDTVELINELERQREGFVAFVRQLPLEQLRRTATYGDFGRFSAADFVVEWAYHDHSHLMQISGIIRDCLWPDFSETMQKALVDT